MRRRRWLDKTPLPTTPLYGDTIFQLKDGRILAYYCRQEPYINVYDQSSFKKSLEINLYKIIYDEKIKLKYDKEKIKKKYEDDSDYDIEEENEEKKEEYYINKLLSKAKISIIQQINNNLIISYSQFIFDINIHENSFDYKIFQKEEENILSINELLDNKIIIITEDNIQVLLKENNNYITKDKYLIDEKWKIEPLSKRSRYYGNFSQYFYSYILPHERLLLNSFSTEISYHGGCGTHPPQEFSYSKIIFIDLKNFKEIKSTKEFKTDAKSIIVKNYIIIQEYYIYLYDINRLDLLKQISFNYHSYLYKYIDDYVIEISIYEEKNNLLVFKVENNNLIKTCHVKTKLIFDEETGINDYAIRGYNNKILYTLKDKRVILLCHENIYVLTLNID